MKQYKKIKPSKFNLLLRSSTKISALNITHYMAKKVAVHLFQHP